jgi:large repetitive protein
MAIVVTIAPPVSSSYVLNENINATVSATGGVAPYTYSDNGTLPSGLSIDSSTGVISGAPTQIGSYDVAITATDSA